MAYILISIFFFSFMGIFIRKSSENIHIFEVLQKFMFLINLLSDEYQKKNSKEVLWYFEDVREFFEKDNIVDSPFWMVDYLWAKIAKQDNTNLQFFIKYGITC